MKNKLEMIGNMEEKHINDGGLMTTGGRSEATVFDSISRA